ncbi:hypothetical protein SAMN02745716_1387 [Thermoleophilum album]|uniref:Uncharacterized protein n=1 Tax=Thermoleophilum album TaxID=29539 RepID=A0A1H6FSN1_THEAL|nr:hypothetical protein SAMN02745716_1387 [Thermoleophilum album]
MSAARPHCPSGLRVRVCVALVATSVTATSVAAGCGGSQSAARGSGRLEWVRAPRVVELTAGRAGRDFIAFGEVRNASLRPLDLNARALEVRAPGGRALPTAVAFQRTFARRVFPLNRRPAARAARAPSTTAPAPCPCADVHGVPRVRRLGSRRCLPR